MATNVRAKKQEEAGGYSPPRARCWVSRSSQDSTDGFRRVNGGFQGEAGRLLEAT